MLSRRSQKKPSQTHYLLIFQQRAESHWSHIWSPSAGCGQEGTFNYTSGKRNYPDSVQQPSWSKTPVRTASSTPPFKREKAYGFCNLSCQYLSGFRTQLLFFKEDTKCLVLIDWNFYLSCSKSHEGKLKTITDHSNASFCLRKMHISPLIPKSMYSLESKLLVICTRNACTTHTLQNHRTLGLGRDLKRSCNPIPTSEQEHVDQVTQYLGTLIQLSYWSHRFQECSRPSKLLLEKRRLQITLSTVKSFLCLIYVSKAT